MRIPETVIQEIRQKTDIVAVISDYVQLTKRGTNYVASCPFHEDRNPSFSVSEPKQIFKCFSCGRGGNVFTFLQEMEGISFLDAVKKVAQLSHIPLLDQYITPETNRKEALNDRLIHLHQKVTEFYHFYLMNTVAGERALQYLLERDVESTTLVTYSIGLSPEQSDALVNYVTGLGYTHSEMEDSGIFYRREDGSIVDRFNGRIIVPLRNRTGQVIAFSGRVYTAEQEKMAKYVNSPETAVFHKSSLVFNLDLARRAIRQRNQVLVCEGYMDVIALHQAGFEHVVATMGTSLTEYHLATLSKMANDIIFVFDGDSAGQKAIDRAFQMSKSLPSSVQCRTITIPNGMDPDEWIRQKGKSSFQQLINRAMSRYEFYQHFLEQQFNLADQHQRAQYIEQMVQQIATIPSPIERELRIQELAAKQQVNTTIIMEQVARILPNQVDQSYDLPKVAQQSFQKVERQSTTFEVKSLSALQSEKRLLAHLMYDEAAWHYLEQHQLSIVLFHEVAQQAFFELSKGYYERGLPLPLSDVINYVEDAQVNEFLTTLALDHEFVEYSDEMIQDCLQVIEKAFIQLQIDELRQKMLDYDKQQRHSEVNEMMLNILQLNRQLKQSKGGN